MLQNQPMKKELTKEDLEGIKSIQDPKVQELINNSPKGKHPYFHAIGTLGGAAVRDKYAKR